MSRRGDPRQALAQGVAAHRAGRLDEAAEHYRRVLEAAPRQPDALNLLASVMLARGAAADARRHAEHAVAAAPAEPSYRVTLGRALLLGGDAERAVRELRRAVAASPGRAEGRVALAAALRAQGAAGEAEAELRAALALQPGAAPICDDLAALLIEQGRYAEAERLVERSLAAQPDGAQAHNHLGVVLARAGRVAEAEQALRRACRLAPDASAPLANLAALLAEQRRWPEACELWRELVARRPLEARGWQRLAEAATSLGEVDEALAAAERAWSLAPTERASLERLVTARRLCGDGEGAARLVAEALAAGPDPELLVMQGTLRRDLGDLAGARAAFEQARALGPELLGPRVALVHSARCTSADDPDLRALRGMLESPELEPRARTLAGFAVAKCLDDLGDAAGAFAAVQRANRARRGERSRYDERQDSAMLARLRSALTADALHAALRAAPPPPAGVGRPVFVVGAPRSGTTLVEQIIAAHPAARTAGELQALPRLAAALAAPGYPEAVLALDPTARAAHAGRYRAAAERAAGGAAARLCDKAPLNFRLLGMVAALLPDALIVHCARHPLDACLSMYLQDFSYGNEFTNDLEDLAGFYANYLATMALWRERLPLAIHEVGYEALVASPEVEARRLVAALELTWDDRCLRPERAPTSVRTASAWQVRQPINARSVAKWQRYAEQLGPLRDALRARGVEA